MRASCIARVTAAHATRSPRYFGTITPRLAAPIVCPARPIRCMPLATDGGASICTTRSMAPMSMPSSSDETAQEAGLQAILDLDTLRARQRSVMRADQRFSRELVQRRGEAFGDPPAV